MPPVIVVLQSTNPMSAEPAPPQGVAISPISTSKVAAPAWVVIPIKIRLDKNILRESFFISLIMIPLLLQMTDEFLANYFLFKIFPYIKTKAGRAQRFKAVKNNQVLSKISLKILSRMPDRVDDRDRAQGRLIDLAPQRSDRIHLDRGRLLIKILTDFKFIAILPLLC
jgi:hypothetical protein